MDSTASSRSPPEPQSCGAPGGGGMFTTGTATSGNFADDGSPGAALPPPPPPPPPFEECAGAAFALLERAGALRDGGRFEAARGLYTEVFGSAGLYMAMLGLFVRAVQGAERAMEVKGS